MNLQLHVKICITSIITSFVDHVDFKKEEKTILYRHYAHILSHTIKKRFVILKQTPKDWLMLLNSYLLFLLFKYEPIKIHIFFVLYPNHFLMPFKEVDDLTIIFFLLHTKFMYNFVVLFSSPKVLSVCDDGVLN